MSAFVCGKKDERGFLFSSLEKEKKACDFWRR
jgi:hypothetical protein